MKRRKVFWTMTAVRQRNFILDYWTERNQSQIYAQKLISLINGRINLLKTNPFLGKNTDYPNTRILSLGHYSIIYLVSDLGIVITGFWDNRQNPSKLLSYLKSPQNTIR
jgi:hypothetical protein